MKEDLLTGHVLLVDTTCSLRPASCFSHDLRRFNFIGEAKALEASAHFQKDHNNRRGRDFKNSLLQFPITNNKLPVRATEKSKSLDLFQRKHDKQAIQRLKRVRKGTKNLSSPFTAPGWNTHNGKPVFNLSHTCAGNLHVRAVLIRVFISTLVHFKGFKWWVNTRYACI